MMLCPGYKANKFEDFDGDPCNQKKCYTKKRLTACVDCSEYPCHKATAGYKNLEPRNISADDVIWAVLPYVPYQYGNWGMNMESRPSNLSRRTTMKLTSEIKQIMQDHFGHDTFLSVATTVDNVPSVRIVNSYYEDGCFYAVTYALSNKMKQIKANPTVAVCGEWFTAHGIGENLGRVKDEKNAKIISKLCIAFAQWYDNGHTNEEDKNTCILCIRLTDGVLFNSGKKYCVKFND